MMEKWPAISRQQTSDVGFTKFIKAIILFLSISNQFSLISCKGGANIGKGGSVNNAGVCLDCGNYTPEEMQVALVILIIILCVFFALCSCQCYNRMKYECNEDSAYNKPHTVPVAPYDRPMMIGRYKDPNALSLSQTNKLTQALMGAISAAEIILPFSTTNYNNV